MNAIRTTHALDFEVAKWDEAGLVESVAAELGIVNDDPYPKIEWRLFRVGTCHGQFRVTPEAYEVLSIFNDTPGNGHLEDVFEWFEFASRTTKIPLRVLRFSNAAFKKHLIDKRGFRALGEFDVEKRC